MLILLVAASAPFAAADAQTAWVTDQFEITLRTGPSTSNAIRLSIPSGTRLEILERDPDSGYTRVRTDGGTEGWVISRYLMDEPSAREQLADLTRQLSSAADEGTSLSSQLNAIRAEYREAEQQIARLEREKQALQNELDEIRRTAANVLAIDNQNQELQEDLTNAEIRIDGLTEEVRALTSEANRNWFITGALVLFGGVILGLLLPKMRWQRRSRYDTF
ncbi:MAG: TIGR04211 family SH3 domain-containing protein [Woeseiaceae bacterium]|nr:TIGR04211 family SH3 domain-containing protein [Woeseiaceae bacterium]